MDEFARRLSDATRHTVAEDVRALHRQAIVTAASVAPPTSISSPRGRQRWQAAGAAVAIAFALPGVAAAAQQAAPGTALFPVKQATEAVRSLVDPAAGARNRLAELERLLDRDATAERLEDAIDRAERAVAALPVGHPLHAQLASLLARAAQAPSGTGDTDVDGPSETGSGSSGSDTERPATPPRDADDDRDDDDTDDDEDEAPLRRQRPSRVEPDDDPSDAPDESDAPDQVDEPDDDPSDAPDGPDEPNELDEADEPDDDPSDEATVGPAERD